jgi:integrase
LATIYDRSRLTVSVKKRRSFTRSFSCNETKAARAYLLELRAQGLEPVLVSEENNFLVRIREKGHPEQTFACTTLEEAEATAQRIEAERHTGLYKDYTQGHRISLAHLIRRYYIEKCPDHKGCDVERYTLKGFYVDAGGDPHDFDKPGAPSTQKPARIRRVPRIGLEWLHRGLAEIKTDDIQGYIKSRRAQGIAPATIDREIDLLTQVFKWATQTLKIHLSDHPLEGVERPRYNNERDRRLTADEEEQFMASAREEDRIRSFELAVKERLEGARAEAAQMTDKSESTRKRYLASARREAEEALKDAHPHIPLFETAMTFLKTTAARCGESLALTWDHARLDGRYALFPTTKNGHPREVPMRAHLIELIAQLPKTHARVFPISSDALQAAFYRICQRAGIEDFHPHDLRHHAISEICLYFRLAGIPLQIHELAKITGHRDLTSLMRYLHMCAGDMAERMDEAYAGAVASGKFRKGRIHVHGKTADLVRSHLGDDQTLKSKLNTGDRNSEATLASAASARSICSARRRRSATTESTQTGNSLTST